MAYNKPIKVKGFDASYWTIYEVQTYRHTNSTRVYFTLYKDEATSKEIKDNVRVGLENYIGEPTSYLLEGTYLTPDQIYQQINSLTTEHYFQDAQSA